jgi:hypothetical protein
VKVKVEVRVKVKMRVRMTVRMRDVSALYMPSVHALTCAFHPEVLFSF